MGLPVWSVAGIAKVGEGMFKRILSFAFSLLLLALISPVVAAQDQTDQPAPGYSKPEINSKLGDFEKRTDADARFREVYRRDEVDALIRELRNLISQNASRAEVDAKIADVKNTLTRALDAAEQLNQQRKTDLDHRIAATDEKIPTMSPAAPLVVSLILAFISLWVSLSIAEKTRDSARLAVREERAYGLVAEWRSLAQKIGRTRDLFSTPGQLRNPDGTTILENYAVIVDVGNWYEGMAEQWYAGATDIDVLRRSGMKDQAKEFRDGLHNARQTLPALDSQIRDWTDLERLASQP